MRYRLLFAILSALIQRLQLRYHIGITFHQATEPLVSNVRRTPLLQQTLRPHRLFDVIFDMGLRTRNSIPQPKCPSVVQDRLYHKLKLVIQVRNRRKRTRHPLQIDRLGVFNSPSISADDLSYAQGAHSSLVFTFDF